MNYIDIIDDSLVEFDHNTLKQVLSFGYKFFVLHDAPYLADLENTDIRRMYVVHPFKEYQSAMDFYANISPRLSPMIGDDGQDGIIHAANGYPSMLFYISKHYL